MAVGLKIVNGDFIINPSGNVEMVQQTEKCARDFGKMLLTAKENPDNTTTYERYNTEYGTDIDNKSLYTGQSRLGKRDTVIMILNDGIASYLKLQESRDNLDFGEVITNVDFDVFYDARDLCNLVVDIKFETAYGGEPISLGPFIQNTE